MPNREAGIRRPEMTLHQLRIFWAVSHATTLTAASKQLGLAQPSLSQQLAKLEESVGAKLFERKGNQMALTDAGRFLVRKAEHILGNVEEAEAGLREFTEGIRGIVRLAGINSVLRVLLPETVNRLDQAFPGLELDVHEVAPAEALELLYGRRVNIGLLAANSIAQSSTSFQQAPIVEDPYVFAVPSGIDLSGITDADADLPAAERRILNRCIQFTFGTQHTRRVEQWYQQVLPHHRLMAQCRSYEVALSMVQSGLGVCLVPAFTASTGEGYSISGVNLYRTNQPNRRIVALMPSQYLRAEPYKSFILTMQEVGRNVAYPPMLPMPDFLGRAAVAG